MEFTVNSNTIIALAALITALGVIGGVARWLYRFVEHNKEQDEEIKSIQEEELRAIRKELTVICYGQLACLKGLKEQGCNGPVTAALDKLEKHLNQAAHDE